MQKADGVLLYNLVEARVCTGGEIMRRKQDFVSVYRRGESLRTANVVLVYLRTSKPGYLGAVVASKKVGSAVRRNRAKRLLREAHRRLRKGADLSGVRAALIARIGATSSSSCKILEELTELYRQAGFIKEAP